MSDYTLHMRLREKFYCFSIFYFSFLNLSSYHLNATLGIWEKSGIFAKLHQIPKNPSIFFIFFYCYYTLHEKSWLYLILIFTDTE